LAFYFIPVKNFLVQTIFNSQNSINQSIFIVRLLFSNIHIQTSFVAGHHGNNEFANAKKHIDGIESFWSFAKSRLVSSSLSNDDTLQVSLGVQIL